MKSEVGRFVVGLKHRKLLVSSSQCYIIFPGFLDSDGSCLLPLFVYSSDFENKFVCGEIMAYDDLHEHGSESAVKAAGKLRQQGKPYESKLFSLLHFSGYV